MKKRLFIVQGEDPGREANQQEERRKETEEDRNRDRS